MNPRLVLVVVPGAARGGEAALALGRQAEAAGLEAVFATEAEAPDRMAGWAAGGDEPALVLIGPGVPNMTACARRLRQGWPTGQILFAPGAHERDVLQRALRHAPMLGPNWSLVEPGDPALAQRLQRAARAGQQRRRLRTTLDRANLRIAAPQPVDGQQYRRMVVSEHYLASLLDQSQDAVLALDVNHAVLYWSRVAGELFGAGAAIAYGMPVAALPFWSEALDACLRRIEQGSGTVAGAERCVLGGRAVDFEIVFARVHDAAGGYIGASVSLRDVSLHNQVLERERAARREAERTSRMKDEFLAVLSHELRTPLSAVLGRTQLLKMQYHGDAALLPALEVIERNARQQAKLIEDLLDVSAVIAGKLHLSMQPVCTRELLEAAAEAIRPAAAHKRIALTVSGAAHGAMVVGDPQRLQQVMSNLLANAVKFTGEGGRIELAQARHGEQVELTVADNGIGIGADFMPLVFDRFGQEDASIRRHHGGLGLGLSIARQLVELHRGTIRATSAGRGLGATFTVCLPLHRAGAHALPAASAPGDGAGGAAASLDGRHILVVEDMPDSRDLIAEIFQRCGAVVHAAGSGAAALQALEGFPAEVLVSDIGLPGMDGYELLRQVRARGFSAHDLPALALTAFASADDRARALGAGFSGYVAKPVVVNEVVAAVARLLAGAPGRINPASAG